MRDTAVPVCRFMSRHLAGRTAICLIALLALLAYVAPGLELHRDACVTAVATSADRGDCEAPCPGDDEEGECPPECEACPCCPTATSAVASLDGLDLSDAVHAERAPDIDAPDETEDARLSRVYRPPRPALT